MLNYHKILSQPSQTKTAKFEHFLTLGAHQSTIRIDPIESLSLITLYPESRLTINQQKIQKGRLTISIPFCNNIRINEKEYTKNSLVFNPKYINEVEKVQSTFMYIVIKQNQQVNTEELSRHFQEHNEAQLSNQIKIRRLILKKDESVQLNKRILIFLKSGKIYVNSTKQQFQNGECLYSKKDCGTIKSNEESEIFMFQFSEKEQTKN